MSDANTVLSEPNETTSEPEANAVTPMAMVGVPVMVTVNEAPVSDNTNYSSDLSDISVALVCQMFPNSLRVKNNIEQNLPLMLQAFLELDFTDRQLILMALATVRAETAGFEPLDEFKSKYNTSANGHPFDLYDNRADLGNRGAPDGNLYKGRGFVQLTGRHNYVRYSKILGLGTQLVDTPELANETGIASKILASFIMDKANKIKTALNNNDLKRARRLINGGSHGLKPFSDAYIIGKKALNL